MTSSEMKYEFLVLYDKITNFDAPGYEDKEISLFLTKAQRRVILRIVNPYGNKYADGYEKTELRRKDLSSIVNAYTTTSTVNQVTSYPNGHQFVLPNDCWLITSEYITATSDDTCVNNKRIKVVPKTHDEVEANINNPFKKPSNTKAWRLDIDGIHEVIIGTGYSIKDYNIRYIKQPRPIIIGANTIEGVIGPIDCELNEGIHQRIVDEAVKIATGVTDPEMYQIKTLESLQNE